MVDQLPNYFAMITGLTKATRARARAAAQALVSQAGLDDVAADANERIAKLTEEISGASRANRELLEKLVASEVDKAASRLGFARSSELSAMRVELTTLGARVAILESRTDQPPAKTAAAKKTTPAKTTPANKSTPANRATPAKKAAAKRAAAKETAAATDPAESAT